MRRNPKKSRAVLFLIIIFLIGLSVLIGLFYWANYAVRTVFGPPSPNLTVSQRVIYPIELIINQDKLIHPFSQVGGSHSFTIGPGESVSMICMRLEQKGLITDAELMQIYLVYTGMDRQLQSGKFMIEGPLSPVQIAEVFLDATPRDVIVTILPGWRIEEVAANVATSGLPITEQAFIDAAYSPLDSFFVDLPLENAPSLEGFLFPGYYVVPREADLDYLINRILSEFIRNFDEILIEGFRRQGLTFYEGLILASIVEREAVVDEEKPLIASVFYNRIALGMRLETDPTVQYSLGFQEEQNSWWKSPLFFSDLTIGSPYNTYLVFGLPPTPIANPGLNSLRAVAFPADTPYYFFRAACDGSGRHNFAITFEEHVNNQCE